MKGAKKLQAEIIKLLPDNWTYQDKLKFFEYMSDMYRNKSRNEVYKDRVVLKTNEGYKTNGKG